jgi:hypothetical protein
MCDVCPPSPSRVRESDEVWCVHNDPCGMCCVGVTYGQTSAPHAQPASRRVRPPAVIVFAVLMPWSGLSMHFWLHTIFFLIVSILAVTSHMRTMLTDPGAVPVGYSPSHLLHEEKGGSMPMCSRCNGFKPPRAHHCSQCDRCIMKMDHHCPWVNNCVGANNQKHFVLFVGYTGLLSGYALVLLGLRTVGTAPTSSPVSGQIGAPRTHQSQSKTALPARRPRSRPQAASAAARTSTRATFC